jgi:hypothetical protein
LATRTILEWVAVTKNEKSGWSQFYRELLGQPLSDTTRFLKAVADFGHEIMFESILAASTRKLEGDPLNYVIAIAVSKVNDEVKQITDSDRYRMKLEKNKQRVIQQNEELEAKMERAKKSNGTK